MAMQRHVLIGGTFACDDTLEQPLALLLREAVVGGDGVDVEWLPYGSASQFASWTPLLQRNSRCIDLVVLLIRVSDLEAAHPELVNGASTVVSSQSTGLMSLMRDLEAYNATASFPQLLLVVCPSPPSQELQYSAHEREFAQRMQSLRKIVVQPSETLTELFAGHNGLDAKFYDRISDKRKHSPYCPSMLNVLSLSLCRQICRLFRTTKKKVIVLDCDNTLWGGAVAEVGVYGIQLSDEFLALQRFVVEQQKQGMLLCLCSKNILQDVVDVFEQRKSDMVLRLDEHIVLSKVNWQAKSANIAMIAKELSLGKALSRLDSFIFIDDNPVECNEVASQLPSVMVINIPPTFSAQFLEEQWIFDDKIGSDQMSGASSTREDAQRTQMYQQIVQRSQLLQSSTSHKAFLSSLGMKIAFEDIIVPARQDSEFDNNDTLSSFARVLQLHQRTNQFNIATSFSRKLTHESLTEYIAGWSGKSRAVCSHVTDRFGHYGLVCVALCRSDAETKTLHVDSFLLSCRALNRGVEHAMIRKLAEVADTLGAEIIKFCWEPTDRNEPAKLLFSSLSEFSFTVTKGNFTKRVESKDEKHRLSATTKGKWEITTSKAASIAFLKVVESHQDAAPVSSLTWKTTLLSSIVSFARSVTQVLLKIALRVLPKWLVAFICSRMNTSRSKLQHSGELGLLRRSFHERHSLNSFIAAHIPQITAEGNPDGKQSDAEESDEQEDSKFRRKARHQTKVALLNHLNDDNPDVIWSANRRVDASSQPHDFDGDSTILISFDSDVLVLHHYVYNPKLCIYTSKGKSMRFSEMSYMLL
uniref:N-acetyltransferase domain-containing protein n=1 Tax=Globisporangium ultimum (strain ATCC 200006 / CBS 805.95 / DAOM BR144) TaxID=431595 RepID=K3WP11_GLOUD